MVGARSGSAERTPMQRRRIADVVGKAIFGIARARLRISASRAILAMIEAAAIDSESASPPMIGRAGQASPSGMSRPSISARSGRRLSALTARAIARKVAPRML